MKKVLLAVILVCLFNGMAFAQYDNTAVCTKSDGDGEFVEYSCAFVDSVAGSATEEFRINADDNTGKIVGYRWESASEALMFWIANSVDETITGKDTIINPATAINLGRAENYSPFVPYLNTLGEKWLYVTVQNDGAIATGVNAILILIYER